MKPLVPRDILLQVAVILIAFFVTVLTGQMVLEAMASQVEAYMAAHPEIPLHLIN